MDRISVLHYAERELISFIYPNAIQRRAEAKEKDEEGVFYDLTGDGLVNTARPSPSLQEIGPETATVSIMRQTRAMLTHESPSAGEQVVSWREKAACLGDGAAERGADFTQLLCQAEAMIR